MFAVKLLITTSLYRWPIGSLPSTCMLCTPPAQGSTRDLCKVAISGHNGNWIVSAACAPWLHFATDVLFVINPLVLVSYELQTEWRDPTSITSWPFNNYTEVRFLIHSYNIYCARI
jgi:hypothetical protein